MSSLSFHAGPAALARLQETVIRNGNVFDELMSAVRVCSLGQITNALFEVGGQYRRDAVLRHLVDLQYQRNDQAMSRAPSSRSSSSTTPSCAAPATSAPK